MYIPISPEAVLFRRHENNFPPTHPDDWLNSIQPESGLSFESQRQLKSLREYVNDCRTILNDIHMDLDRLRLSPDNPSILFQAAKRLGPLCLEADRWGFEPVYQLAITLQKIFLEPGSRSWNNPLSEALNKGLGALYALVERCETEFRWKLALDDTLDSLGRAVQHG